MAIKVYRQTAVYRDARGFTARITFCIAAETLDDATTVGGLLVPALSLLTNGVLQRSIGPYTGFETDLSYGSTDEYQSVNDKLTVVFTTGDGGAHRYQVPAPKAALFLADSETADPGNADLAAFYGIVLANAVCGREGDVLTRFVGGQLNHRKRAKRIGTYVFRPDLSGPDW